MPVDQKSLGAFYTPNEIAQTLVRWVVRAPSDLLLDPSCGDGRFLAFHGNAVGVERDSSAARIARERAPKAGIYEGDFFAWAERSTQRFDCVVGNPPFIRYQRFSGSIRETALSCCARLGVRFSSLCSSWAPFVVMAANTLRRGGRMALVVPAEIGHAPYAVPLLWYLVDHFASVQVIAVWEKAFPHLSEDTWILYADRFGDRSESIVFTQWDEFMASASPALDGEAIAISEWEKWRCRLRPFLLPLETRRVYSRLVRKPGVERLDALARVGIGYVTGANDFFHLRPSVARSARIPNRFLRFTVRNARTLPPLILTAQTTESWVRRDQPVLLLHLARGQKLPDTVLAYLDSPAGQEAKGSYKCRNRQPWYAVPDVRVPDGFLSYMSGEGPLLVANAAGCTCTNSLHAVELRDGVTFSDLQSMWRHPLARLSCELEGHPLGGGLLKLEPKEAARVVMPPPDLPLSPSELRSVEEGVRKMRRWRHYE